MKKVPNRKVKVKLNKIILQVLLLILILAALITQKDSILNILTNKSEIKAGIPEGMKVGDIIKYDHKTGVDPSLLKTTIGKGTASIPGSTYEQTFDASTIDTTWHVWSIDRENDEIMIVSDNVAPFRTKGAIDYIWYEHNMHQIASIFGHGKGAKKKEFIYKVGSQLEDTGDTATWKTGYWEDDKNKKPGIPLTGPEGIPGITTKEGLKNIAVPESGARPLRTEDIEKAFGWTESSIKTDSKFTRYGNNWGGTTTLNINFPQRKVEGTNQTWDNEAIAKGPKKNVTAYNRGYHINKDKIINENDTNVSEEKKKLYKQYINILWDWNGNGIYQLGQVNLDVRLESVGFSGDIFSSGYFYSMGIYFARAHADGRWFEDDYTTPARVAAFLSSSDIVYRKSVDNEGNDIKGKNQESIWEMEDEKELPKLPEGMQIGDIVNYDHKDVLRIEDARNNIDGIKTLKTTIGEGTASTPGSTFKQEFDGNKIDTKWRVWGVDENTGDVIILSDNVAPFKTYGAIDYIWYEHNTHKIASIFGHGKGAKKKIFEYKVGSQLEDTGDTATWKTGYGEEDKDNKPGIPIDSPGGIPGIKTKEKLKNIVVPYSGARPLRTEDIEKVFGWTESDIKKDTKFYKQGENWGGTTTLNINYPQRKADGINQTWDNEQIAKGTKKNVTAYNRSYYINKDKIIDENNTNISKEKEALYKQYRNILWEWNGNKKFQLGQVGLGVYSSHVYFCYGAVNSSSFDSANSYFVNAYTYGTWREHDPEVAGRVLAFLSSSDIIYRKSSAVGDYQEGIWDIELRSPATKNITVNVKNMTGKDIKDGEVKLITEGADKSVLETGKVAFTKDKDYSVNKSGIVMKDNKYKMYVEGLPTGTDYKILSHYNEKESGKTHTLEQDILSFKSEDVTYDILIYPKDGKYIVPVTYEGGKEDKSFAVKGILTLTEESTNEPTMQMRSATPVSTPANESYTKEDVKLKPGITNVEFDNVKLFDEVTNELKEYTLEFKKTSPDNHEVEITEDNKIIVRYEPPQKEISVKTSLVLLDETTKIPVTLVADKADKPEDKTTEIELSNTNGYKYNKEHPVNIENGEGIKYTLDTSKIDKSKYITSVEKVEYKNKIEFILTIRPVLTLPMSGSDSMKVMGITLGLCTLAGFAVRAKNKFVVVFKKYDIMK